MPELRQNKTTREWVIIATDRAKRPEEFISKAEKKILPELKPGCVFCPGSEDKTPPEVFRNYGSGIHWCTRVVPNKFAALSPKTELLVTHSGLFRKMGGYGYHEVIVETPKHNTTTALLEQVDIENIIGAYLNRFEFMTKDPLIKNIILFKNHGDAAGTSLEHPHSQIVGTPVVPQQVRSRVEIAMSNYDDHHECLYCRILADEIKEGTRIIAETEHFACFTPFAALTPFHTWIFPKKHNSTFGSISDKEAADLAKIMRLILRKFYFGLNNPDFNYVFRSAPTGGQDVNYFHWYISIIPRLTKSAGFELGSGMFINVSLPEENAKFLREFTTPG
ncbi:MAG: galactose-1-phosphate uridylyltransferase [Candidatus Firestonebacteria bacterium]